MIPDLPPPKAEAYARPISFALPLTFLSTASKHGTPPPLRYSPLTV